MGETKNENLTHAEYLELPDVKAADEKEKAYYAEKRIDEEYNAQFVKAREKREKAMKDFRQEILDSVWENTEVANLPYGESWHEWAAEYIIPRGKEKEVDAAIDAAFERLLSKLEAVR